MNLRFRLGIRTLLSRLLNALRLNDTGKANDFSSRRGFRWLKDVLRISLLAFAWLLGPHGKGRHSLRSEEISLSTLGHGVCEDSPFDEVPVIPRLPSP